MSRSEHVDLFQQDAEAETFDETMAAAHNPMGGAYRALLTAVASLPFPSGEAPVVDAGCGTGALAMRLPPHCRPIYAVDASAQMLEAARRKLGRQDAVELFQEDLLELATESTYPLRALVSTLALHALTDAEKDQFVAAVADRLEPGGIVAVGDLMTADGEAPKVAPPGAFLWSIEAAAESFTRAGLAEVDLSTVGDGVWVVSGRKR